MMLETSPGVLVAAFIKVGVRTVQEELKSLGSALQNASAPQSAVHLGGGKRGGLDSGAERRGRASGLFTVPALMVKLRLWLGG